MKTKFLLLLFLFLNSSLISFPKDTITMSIILEPYVKEFLDEGIKRDLFLLDKLLKNVDLIVLDKSLKYPILGGYDPKRKIIVIAEYTLVDSLLVKSTVFHELGHAMGLQHSCIKCRDIMSQKNDNTLKYYYEQSNWNKQLNIFYKKIKP